MTLPAASPHATIAIDGLGLDQGAHLLVKRALGGIAVGDTLRVHGSGPAWDVHLLAWCRQQGHAAVADPQVAGAVLVTRGPFQQG
ncbi:MAG: ferritin-like domain-containing protein, partial [Comamonadaceae bacterium]